MRSIAILVLAAAALVGCAATPGSFEWEHAPPPPAASPAPEMGGAPAAQEQRAPDGAGSSGNGRNVVDVTVGYTFDRGGGGLTVGAMYEYLLREDMGVGAFGEYVAGDKDDVGVLGGGVYFHPRDRTRVLVGVGFELGNDTDFLARVGASYEYPLGTMTLSPAGYIDFTTGGNVALLVGFSFGKKF